MRSELMGVALQCFDHRVCALPSLLKHAGRQGALGADSIFSLSTKRSRLRGMALGRTEGGVDSEH